MFNRFSIFAFVFVVFFLAGLVQGDIAYDWDGSSGYTRLNSGPNFASGNILQLIRLLKLPSSAVITTFTAVRYRQMLR